MPPLAPHQISRHGRYGRERPQDSTPGFPSWVPGQLEVYTRTTLLEQLESARVGAEAKLLRLIGIHTRLHSGTGQVKLRVVGAIVFGSQVQELAPTLAEFVSNCAILASTCVVSLTEPTGNSTPKRKDCSGHRRLLGNRGAVRSVLRGPG